MDGEARKFDPEIERVLSVLRERGAKGSCPVCDENVWIPLGELGNLLGYIPGMNAEGEALEVETGRGAFPVYVVTCGNCAFIRLHAAYLVDQASEQP